MSQAVAITVPDIGDYENVDVIEVMVKPGDTVRVDDSLITLETDKASMEIPATAAGVVQEVLVKVGDKISEGATIVLLQSAPAVAAATPDALPTTPEPPLPPTPAPPQALAEEIAIEAKAEPEPIPSAPADTTDSPHFHASPSVRRFARELGVDVARVTGTGPKGRVLHSDVQGYVKSVVGAGSTAAAVGSGTSAGLQLAAWPVVDFTKFGTVEVRPLSRIRKISAANLARNWAMIPHVTQFDEADITETEAFRKQLGEELKGQDVKLTLLAFVLKAAVAALKKFPEFNASLDGEQLVLKHYYHLGFAAETPNGLVVPVLRDVDRKSLLELAGETATLAAAARAGKLAATDMQGGCFTISSLGGIGGTAFTPIINAPEVAILGVSRAAWKPVWDGATFQPRLMLPLSLSYDHRVIDGALAARFTAYLALVLRDLRRLSL